jgi:hypothetical protein
MRARKVDANQREIVQALRQAGWHVTDLSAVGGGVPDLLATQFGQAHLVEVKTGERKYYFTQPQLDYQVACKANIFVIRDIKDVISFIKGRLQPINSEKQGINGRKTAINAQRENQV